MARIFVSLTVAQIVIDLPVSWMDYTDCIKSTVTTHSASRVLLFVCASRLGFVLFINTMPSEALTIHLKHSSAMLRWSSCFLQTKAVSLRQLAHREKKSATTCYTVCTVNLEPLKLVTLSPRTSTTPFSQSGASKQRMVRAGAELMNKLSTFPL